MKNKYIPQVQLEKLQELIQPNKVIVIYGPRRCGKTTLLEKFRENLKEEYMFVNGENKSIQENLSPQSIEHLRNFLGKTKLLIIDEAQKIPNVGINLKLIVDHVPGIKVVATGSSSFDLVNQIGEPLLGRKYTLPLFPLAQLELQQFEAWHETEEQRSYRLIYGSYPEIVLMKGDRERQEYLEELASSVLYKDILELDGIKKSGKISQLLELLAFQVGQQVSLTELGTQLGMSKNTVERYLDLLEKTFVIFHLWGFSRNLRKEVTKTWRYYFYDVGIRNAIIRNFNPLHLRDDVGMLWENYIIVERMKKQKYTPIYANNYFWRTYDQKEIDLVEEREGKLFGYEIKWGAKKPKPPKLFLETYKNAEYLLINQENYLEFIT